MWKLIHIFTLSFVFLIIFIIIKTTQILMGDSVTPDIRCWRKHLSDGIIIIIITTLDGYSIILAKELILCMKIESMKRMYKKCMKVYNPI